MSTTKTGLMFSPLTQNIYWGRMNTKTGMAIGNAKKDVTSDFICIMLQKFEINTRQNIECNGKIEAVVFVVDEEKSHKYNYADEMYKVLNQIQIEGGLSVARHKSITELMAKARGESTPKPTTNT